MLNVIKLSCVAVYLAALAALFVPFPGASFLPTVAVILLGAHLAEMVVFMKDVRKYPGPLAISLVLTLAFGAAHWMPLRRLAKADLPQG